MANTGSGSQRPAVQRLFARSRWSIASIVLWESNGYSECDGLGYTCLSALRRIAASRSAPTHVRGCLGIALSRAVRRRRPRRATIGSLEVLAAAQAEACRDGGHGLALTVQLQRLELPRRQDRGRTLDRLL